MNREASETWPILQPILKELRLDPVRVENVVAGACPDVNYTHGWIELKRRVVWPERAATPVLFDSLTSNPEQVAWLTRRWRSGGPCWLMAHVGRELHLFAGIDAAHVRNGLTALTFRTTSVWSKLPIERWADKTERLRQWLTWDAESLPFNEAARLYRLRCGKSIEEVAVDLKVSPLQVRTAELGLTPLSSDLVEYWIA